MVRGRARRVSNLMKQHQARMEATRKGRTASRPGTRPAAGGGGGGGAGPTIESEEIERQNQATLALAEGQDVGDDNITVRHFHMNADGRVHRSERDAAGFTQSDDDQLLKRQLAELEGQLQETMQLMERLKGQTGAEQLREKYGLGGEDKNKTKKKKGGGGKEDRVELTAEEAALADAVRIGERELSTLARGHARKLTTVLRLAARQLLRGAVDGRLISAVWGRYATARGALAEEWQNVPPAAWTVLWEVLAWNDQEDTRGHVKNPRRLRHVYHLAKDMQAAGVALTDAQQLVAMEAMCAEGWVAAAVDNWRRAAATVGARAATATAYWTLGVRICVRAGDLARAERAVAVLFGAEHAASREDGREKADPRVLLEMIRGYVGQNQKDKAWAEYRRLKDLLEEEAKTAATETTTTSTSDDPSPGITIDDYDAVVSCFLSANETEYAFDVFVDMMFSGALDLHSTTTTTTTMTPGKLPAAVANHFFFGKWLKRLIGAGDLDGAYRVLVFMQSHRIVPAAVQVNGLLGAWMRSGTAANQARADRLAWRMIDARRRFVDVRRRSAATAWRLQYYMTRERERGATPTPTKEAVEAAIRGVTETPEKEEDDEFTFVPRASLETFMLVAESYKNRGLVEPLEELWTAFRACEMVESADAFMMDQLVESYVRSGQPGRAHALYAQLVHGPSRVVPSVHTFVSLFRALAVHVPVSDGENDERRAAAAQTARRLVADLARLPAPARRGPSGGAAEDEEAVRQDPVLQRDIGLRHALGRLVLHALRRCGDYVAFIVLLGALRPLLGGRFAVSDSLAVELVAEVDGELGRRNTVEARRRIFRASEVVEALLRERMRAREKQQQAATEGVTPSAADLSDDLAAAVAHVYRRQCMGVTDAAFASMYEAAVKEMRLEEFVGGRRRG